MYCCYPEGVEKLCAELRRKDIEATRGVRDGLQRNATSLRTKRLGFLDVVGVDVDPESGAGWNADDTVLAFH